jgi:predicted histidine transporter YuiF (NhaC family)
MLNTYYVIYIVDKGYFYKNIFSNEIENAKKYLSLKSVIKACSLIIKKGIISGEFISIEIVKEKSEKFGSQQMITRKIKQTLNFTDINHYMEKFGYSNSLVNHTFVPDVQKNVIVLSENDPYWN